MSDKIITKAISAVLALGIAGASAAVADTGPEGGEKCYGIVKAGKNDCATNRHSCSGEAKKDCERDEWVILPAGACNKITNGKTTEK